ncbi:MAG TPA: tetratricopeptide repeat protein [Pyrinomonadaceae bacterium]|nr:tetratricopeptide repeat protein [Pyrinomonadaceae bacterium]
MARTSKKRARELKHDKFRDATLSAFDRLNHRIEGRRRLIIYAVAGLAAVALAASLWSWWSGQREAEARAALGRAIQVSEAVVTASPPADSKEPTFPSERERAQAALKEFESVAAKYGDPYDDIARFMAASQLLSVDRPRALSELESLSKSGNDEVAARATFALAQAREAEKQYDAAVPLYQSLLKDDSGSIPNETVNLRLASIYEKQGKKDEAATLLFDMIKKAREAKDKEGKPVPPPAAVSDAADLLRRIDPTRYDQLPPETPAAGGLPF